MAAELAVAITLATTFSSSSSSSSGGGEEEEEKEKERRQQAVLEAEAAQTEVMTEHEALQTALQALMEEVGGIEERLPLLEMEKKEAAGRKDYKEAGAKMKEIKALVAREEEAKASMVALRQGLSELSGLLREREEGLTAALAALQEKEAEEEARRVAVLDSRARTLRKAKGKLDQLVGARVVLQTSATLLLSAELEATEGEALALRQRFNLPPPAPVKEEEEEDWEEGEEEVEEEEEAGAQVVSPNPDEEESAGREEMPQRSTRRRSSNSSRPPSSSSAVDPPPSLPTPAAAAPQEEEEEEQEIAAVAATAAAAEQREEEEEEGGAAASTGDGGGGPSATEVARARELHVAILSLEEKVGQAAAEEDYELAEALQAQVEALKEEMAVLGIDCVGLVMGSDSEEEEEEEAG